MLLMTTYFQNFSFAEDQDTSSLRYFVQIKPNDEVEPLINIGGVY